MQCLVLRETDIDRYINMDGYIDIALQKTNKCRYKLTLTA